MVVSPSPLLLDVMPPTSSTSVGWHNVQLRQMELAPTARMVAAKCWWATSMALSVVQSISACMKVALKALGWSVAEELTYLI